MPEPVTAPTHTNTAPGRGRVAVFVVLGGVALWLLGITAGNPAIDAAREETERILADAAGMTLTQEGLVTHTYQPTSGSGVTLCYGYDMGRKSRARVEADLETIEPPLPDLWVERLAGGAGRSSGIDAFLDVTRDIELTQPQCATLFTVTYAAETASARDFATNPDEYGQHGIDYPPVDWDGLNPAIQGVVIDLKFRGDYRPWWTEQQALQQAMIDNDPIEVLRQIERAEIFPADLPPIRYQARVDWMRRILDAG